MTCSYSAHFSCLGEHDTECPNCARSHGMIREIRRNNERLADQHDVYLSEVKEGGFAAGRIEGIGGLEVERRTVRFSSRVVFAPGDYKSILENA